MKDKAPQVLLLEDNEKYALSLEKKIKRGFNEKVDIWKAYNLDDAKQLLREQENVLDVIITDIVMSNGKPDGLELVSKVAGRFPVIIMTAHSPEDYIDKVENVGPVVFLKKGTPYLHRQIVSNVRHAVSWKAADERIGPEEREVNSLSLSREKGAILAVRFHFAPVNEYSFGDANITNWDFASLAVGFRHWQQEVESRGGRLCSFHGQMLIAVFEDSEKENAFRQAIESARAASHLDGQKAAVFYRCPFSAAVLMGINVSGMFGRRIPGYPAIVGRLGDIAYQVALTGGYGEVAIIPNDLPRDEKKWADSLTNYRRYESLNLVGLTGPVDVEYIRF